jgi:putative SOS response-associated peptidase YedK
VGDEHAQKTNSWLMMTNSMDEAVKMIDEIPNGQIKTIRVKEKSNNDSSK